MEDDAEVGRGRMSSYSSGSFAAYRQNFDASAAVVSGYEDALIYDGAVSSSSAAEDEFEDVEPYRGSNSPTWRLLLFVVAVVLVLSTAAIIVGFTELHKGSGGSGRTPDSPAPQLQPTVILISMDGFRTSNLLRLHKLASAHTHKLPTPTRKRTPSYDYLDRANGTLTPNLNEFYRQGGLRIRDGLVPVFQTKTFPNHYTLVTGRYEENHGIVGNNMYDPVFREYFNTASTETKWWNGSEPLWVTAVKQGMPTATYFWPGSAAEINGHRPTYWLPYNFNEPFENRVDQVLAWLRLRPEERPRFITLYFEEPDFQGHQFGPDSPQVNTALRRMDQMFGRLLQGLRRGRVLDQVHVIVTADHGMAATSQERRIGLRELITSASPDSYEIVDVSPVAAIRAKEEGSGVEELIYQDLKAAQERLGLAMAVYRREEVPARLRYSSHRRIQPVIVVAEEGWSLVRTMDGDPQVCCGTHGYDPQYMSMHPVFLARGPGFIRPGGTVDAPLHSVDVYLLMCRLLGVVPQETDGDLTRVEKLLLQHPMEDIQQQ